MRIGELSGPEAGLLTSLPVLAFAVFGALAPTFARNVGVHRAAAASLVAVVVGLGGRATVDHDMAFLVLSAVALGGMATANVLLPSLVKLHFPQHIGRATAVYTTALATLTKRAAGPRALPAAKPANNFGFLRRFF